MLHLITFYGGRRERVTVVSDNTHTDYGFRYGSMRVVGENGIPRTVHFGLYNATDVQEISYDGVTHVGNGIKRNGDTYETWTTGDVEFNVYRDRRTARIYVETPLTRLYFTTVNNAIINTVRNIENMELGYNA